MQGTELDDSFVRLARPLRFVTIATTAMAVATTIALVAVPGSYSYYFVVGFPVFIIVHMRVLWVPFVLVTAYERWVRSRLGGEAQDRRIVLARWSGARLGTMGWFYGFWFFYCAMLNFHPNRYFFLTICFH